MLQRLFNAFKPAVRPVSRPADGAPDPAVDIAHGLVLGGQSSAARGVLERRLNTNPDDADALALQGWVLFDLGESDQARAVLSRALQLAPGHVEALNTLGALDADDPDPNLSVRWFRAALQSDPGNLGAQYNLAQKLFFLGEYEEGFRLLRTRHRLHFKRDNPLEPMPMWQGENLAGKTVFVWCDWGGLGDHLQFVRYLSLLRQRAAPARLVLGARAECARLFATLPGVDEMVAPGIVPAADVHCPLLDLPFWFNTTLGNMPARDPYLCASQVLATQWRGWLAAHGLPPSGLRVGIVSGNDQRSGSVAHERVRLAKSVPADQFAALAASGAVFVNLQPGVPKSDLSAFGVPVIDAASDITDFADTAAIMTQLDLIVTADTSAAHLAGAMGKPVWLLLRYASGMFWLNHREDSPWYGSMRIFRQDAPGNWHSALACAGALLLEHAAGKPNWLNSNL